MIKINIYTIISITPDSSFIIYSGTSMIVYVWEKKISSVVGELKMRLVMSEGQKKNIKEIMYECVCVYIPYHTLEMGLPNIAKQHRYALLTSLCKKTSCNSKIKHFI